MLVVGGLLVLVVVVVVEVTRGGGNGGKGSAQTLTGSVSRSKADVSGSQVVAPTRVRFGGIPGTRVTLKWDPVDSLSGRASVEDRVAKRFTTTANTTTHDVAIRFRKPATPSHYIINFALFGPTPCSTPGT